MENIDSILSSIKKQLSGINEDEVQFDSEIIMAINSTLAILTQLGVGPPQGFSISDKNSMWEDFIGANKKLEFVKTYVYLKVKLLFDPPLSSAAIDSIKQSIDEYSWRISVAVEEVV